MIKLISYLCTLVAVAAGLWPSATWAAEAAAPRVQGLPVQGLPVALALPFAGLLASIALGPVLMPRFWHHHDSKIATLWGGLALLGLGMELGQGATLHLVVHTLLTDYVPFVVMLFALYTAAGGLVLRGDVRATPLNNTGLLALGTACASLVGTTGAAMIFIRPLLRANAARQHNKHVAIFFVFLVANIGGALSPLGDPPLFMGFLRGVPFFWPLQHLWAPTLFVSLTLLTLFFAVDVWAVRHDPPPKPVTTQLSLHGRGNLALIALAVTSIVVSGVWHSGVVFDVMGTSLLLQTVLRDGVLLCVGLASWIITPQALRQENHFTWAPLQEVAMIFAALFVCLAPVVVMLAQGAQGPFAPLLSLVQGADGTPSPVAYFWLTGLLSSFLDNAPTYLVFFQLAGGDATQMTGPLAPVLAAMSLAAMSLGAVFMGAGTYIGNAPNFMVYAMARQAGIKMPGFFGYLVWSVGILVPVFVAVSFLFVRV